MLRCIARSSLRNGRLSPALRSPSAQAAGRSMRQHEIWLVVEAGKHRAQQAPARCRRRRRHRCRQLPPPTLNTGVPAAIHGVSAAAVGYAVYMASLRLAQRVSPMFSGYRALSKEQQLEWDGRCAAG